MSAQGERQNFTACVSCGVPNGRHDGMSKCPVNVARWKNLRRAPAAVLRGDTDTTNEGAE